MKLADELLKPVQREIVFDPLASFFKKIKVFMDYGFDGTPHMTLVERHDVSTFLDEYSLSDRMECEINREIILSMGELAAHETCRKEKSACYKIHIRRYHEIYKMHQIQKMGRDYVRLKLTVPMNGYTEYSEMENSKQDLRLAEDLIYEKLPNIIRAYYPVYEKAYIKQIHSVWDTNASDIGIGCEKPCYVIRQSIIKDISYDKIKGDLRIKPDLGYELDQLRINQPTEFDSVTELLIWLNATNPYFMQSLKIGCDGLEKRVRSAVQSKKDAAVEIIHTGIIIDPIEIMFDDSILMSTTIDGKKFLKWNTIKGAGEESLNQLADRIILDISNIIDTIKSDYGDKLNEKNMGYSIVHHKEIVWKPVSCGLDNSDLALMLDMANQLNVMIYDRLCEILPIAMVDIIESDTFIIVHAALLDGSTTMFHTHTDSVMGDATIDNISRQVEGRDILKTISHLYDLSDIRTDQTPTCLNSRTEEKEETETDGPISKEPKVDDDNGSSPLLMQLDIDPLNVLLIAYPDLNTYYDLWEKLFTGYIPDEWSYRTRYALSTIRPDAWDNLQKFANTYSNLKDKSGIKTVCVFHHAKEIVIKNKSGKSYTQDSDIASSIKNLVNAMACRIYTVLSEIVPFDEVAEETDAKRTYEITGNPDVILCKVLYKDDESTGVKKSIPPLYLYRLCDYDNFSYVEINETEQSANDSKTESKEINGSLRDIVSLYENESRDSASSPTEEIDTEEKMEEEVESLTEEIPSDQFERSNYSAIIHIDPYMILEHLCPLAEGYQKFMDGSSAIETEKIRHYLIENYVQTEISEIAKKPTAYMISHFRSIAVETFNHPTTRSSSRFLIPMINKITGIIYDTLSKSSKHIYIYAEYVDADRDSVLREELVIGIRRMMKREDCEHFYNGSEEFYIVDPELESYDFTINPLQVLLVAYPDLTTYVDLEYEIVKKGFGFDKTKVYDALDTLYPGALNYLQMFLVGCRRMHYDDPLKVSCRFITAKETILPDIKDSQLPDNYLHLPKEERIYKRTILLSMMMKILTNKMAVCIYDLLNEIITINEILKYRYRRLTYDLSGDVVSCTTGEQLPDVSTIIPSQLLHLYHVNVVVTVQNSDGNKASMNVTESPCRINTPLNKEESSEELIEFDYEDEELDSEEEETSDQIIQVEYDPVEILWNSICHNFRIGVLGKTKYLILDRSTIYEQFCSDEHVKNNSSFMDFMKEWRRDDVYITVTELNNTDRSRIRELLEKNITCWDFITETNEFVYKFPPKYEETYLRNSIDRTDRIEKDVIISIGSDDELRDGNIYTDRIVTEFKRLLFAIIKLHIPINAHLTKKEDIMKCNENVTRPLIEVGYDSLEIFLDVMTDILQSCKTPMHSLDLADAYIKKAFFNLIGEVTLTDLCLNPIEFKNNREKNVNIWKYFIYSDMVSSCEEFMTYRKTMDPDYEGYQMYQLYDGVVFRDTLTEKSWENRAKRYTAIIAKYSPLFPYCPSYWDDLYTILRKRLVHTVLPEIFTQTENSKDSSESEE